QPDHPGPASLNPEPARLEPAHEHALGPRSAGAAGARARPQLAEPRTALADQAAYERRAVHPDPIQELLDPGHTRPARAVSVLLMTSVVRERSNRASRAWPRLRSSARSS